MAEEPDGLGRGFAADWDEPVADGAASDLSAEKVNEARIDLQPAYYGDLWFYRIVGLTLSLLVAFSVAGMFVLAYNEIPIPEAIIAVVSTAVGALAGVLASSKR